MTEAAQAPIGEGPLRPALAKDPKTLQAEISRLMTSCEKLRARKRFFANKVEEINNPPPPPPRAPPPAHAHPLLGTPSPQHAVAEADPSPTSLDGFAQAIVQMHASNGPASLPPSDQMRLVESWVVTPPTTCACTPTAPPRTATCRSGPHGRCDPAAGGSTSAVSGGDAQMMEASHDSPANHDTNSQGHAEGDSSNLGSKQRAQGMSQPGANHLSRGSHETHKGGNPNTTAARHGTSRLDHVSGVQVGAELLPVAAHPVSRPEAAHSMHASPAQGWPASRPSSDPSMQSAQRAQHGQRAHHPSSSPLSLSWGDGVRAPAGVALAIGPWAHTTSDPLPVPRQAVLFDPPTALATEPHANQLSHQQPVPQSCDQADKGAVSTAAQADYHMGVDDQPAAAQAAAQEAAAEAAQEAADRAEAVRAVMSRATSPDDEGGASSQMCNVCLCPIRQLLIVLQPCGHYYCESCTASIRGGWPYPRCPECRTRISSTFRVPLSSSHSHTLREDAQHAQVRSSHSTLS